VNHEEYETYGSENESMHRLIRLKRHEQPPEGYYANFLREFHRRQRAELLKPSLTTLLFERISSVIAEFHVPASAYAAVAGLAMVASVGIVKMTPSPAAIRTPAAYAVSYPASSYSSRSPYSQTPVTIEKMQPVSLRVDSPSAQNYSQFFPTTSSLQALPASHESPLSF
jgi:hypothetical protein